MAENKRITELPVKSSLAPTDKIVISDEAVEPETAKTVLYSTVQEQMLIDQIAMSIALGSL